MDNVMLDVGEENWDIYDMSPMTLKLDFKFSLVTLDSVIDVRLVFSQNLDEPPFELLNHAGDGKDGKFLYIFTDTYMSELADSMRARGRKPYRIEHEYVVNSTRQDFTLLCVSPDRTWEYEIASGDSAEIERQWLMEWAGTDGGHYEFVFKDSTLVTWPADKRYYQPQGVHLGDDVSPRRYFNFTVSRDGGGMRRYEITDGLLQEIATEMVKVRKAQPQLFL